MKCDYCDNLAQVKLTVHNKKWELCLDCAKKNKERLLISDKQLETVILDMENTNEDYT